MQHDRSGLVGWQPIAHILVSRRRQDFDDAVCREILQRFSNLGKLSMGIPRQSFGADPNAGLVGQRPQHLPLDRRGDMAFDEGE